MIKSYVRLTSAPFKEVLTITQLEGKLIMKKSLGIFLVILILAMVGVALKQFGFKNLNHEGKVVSSVAVEVKAVEREIVSVKKNDFTVKQQSVWDHWLGLKDRTMIDYCDLAVNAKVADDFKVRALMTIIDPFHKWEERENLITESFDFIGRQKDYFMKELSPAVANEVCDYLLVCYQIVTGELQRNEKWADPELLKKYDDWAISLVSQVSADRAEKIIDNINLAPIDYTDYSRSNVRCRYVPYFNYVFVVYSETLSENLKRSMEKRMRSLIVHEKEIGTPPNQKNSIGLYCEFLSPRIYKDKDFYVSQLEFALSVHESGTALFDIRQLSEVFSALSEEKYQTIREQLAQDSGFNSFYESISSVDDLRSYEDFMGRYRYLSEDLYQKLTMIVSEARERLSEKNDMHKEEARVLTEMG